MASSFAERSQELNRRFLGDPEPRLPVGNPSTRKETAIAARVASEASSLAEWLESGGVDAGLEAELVHFLAGSVFCTALTAYNNLGSWQLWSERAERARRHASLSTGTAELFALLDHVEAIRLCQRYESSKAEAMARTLIPRFESLECFDQAARVRFLLARTVKDQGRSLEALKLFEEVGEAAVEGGDIALQCLALCMRAQALGAQGQFEAAFQLVAQAVPLARCSGWPLVEAEIKGTEGELLRDRGDLIGSIVAYSGAMRCYERLGMLGFAAYVRVVLAETLVLAARPLEAVGHIAAALEIIDQRNISSEAFAAIRILRKALRRQKGDFDALHRLRNELHRMKDEGRL